MSTVIEVVNYISANYQQIITVSTGFLTGLIGVFMLIPGDQPEKTLQSIVDFIAKFSVKKN